MKLKKKFTKLSMTQYLRALQLQSSSLKNSKVNPGTRQKYCSVRTPIESQERF